MVGVQVNSYGSRNFAVNVWFERFLPFNDSDCALGEDLSGRTLADYDFYEDSHAIAL